MKTKLTLAITGHRDIIVTEKLKQEVDDYLETLLQKYQTKEIILFSPLADGADKLVAKLFLNKKENYPNLTLHVPMPFTQERYIEDFNEASKKEFLDLLKSSQKIFTVPSPKNENSYQTLGYYVADKSDILLALWDSTFNGKSGGTGDVVAYAQGQEYKVKTFLCERISKT